MRARSRRSSSVDAPSRDDGRPAPQVAVLAADGAARRPRRDDPVAEGSSTRSGDKFAPEPGLRRPVHVQGPRRRRPHHARQVAVLLRQGEGAPRARSCSRSMTDPTLADAGAAGRATSRSRTASSRPTCRRSRRTRAVAVIKAADDRLPGHHAQHREQERPAEAVLERRHRPRPKSQYAAHGVRAGHSTATTINKVVFGGLNQPDCYSDLARRARGTRPRRASRATCMRTSNQAKQLVEAVGRSRTRSVHLMLGHRPGRGTARPGDPVDGEAAVGINVVIADRVRHVTQSKADAGSTTRSRSVGRAASTPTATSTIPATTGSQNDSGYWNAGLDPCSTRAQAAATLRRGSSLLPRGAQPICDDRPLIYLYHPVNRDAEETHLDGVHLFGDGLLRVAIAGYRSSDEANRRSWAASLRKAGAALIVLLLASIAGLPRRPGDPGRSGDRARRREPRSGGAGRDPSQVRARPAVAGAVRALALARRCAATSALDSGIPVGHTIVTRLPITLELALLAILFGDRDRRARRDARRGPARQARRLRRHGGALVGLSVPHFWLGLLMIICLRGRPALAARRRLRPVRRTTRGEPGAHVDAGARARHGPRRRC